MSTFALRFYAPPVPGQIGPQQRGFLLKDASLASAKRRAKEKAAFEGWRLAEVFEIHKEEVSKFIHDGWREEDEPSN